jgi:peptidyl-prolyl cis-trans isomerase SurA
MSASDVEGPIEAGNGFHIIQLVDKRGGTEQMVNQTNFRHIMLEPNEIRNEEQTIKAIKRLRERILAGEEFAPLARQNSDDVSSVVAGGDLDWINEGGMPLEMALIIDPLEVGELSDVFQTEAGWHIAEVLGRREADLSSEYSRAQAENALRSRKFDLELQNWLIEIREEAFVEVVE